jgi:PKD repeat protein
VTARSDFPVKAGMTAVVIPVAVGGGGGSTVPPVASFMINGDPDLDAVAGTHLQFTYEGSSVTLYFSDTSNPGITSSWYFDDGSPDSTEPNPTHTFTCTLAFCTYRVVLTSGNPYGTSTAHMHLYMTAGGTYDFTADRTVIAAGETVTFTDASVPGFTPESVQYTWTFGDGSAPETTASPSITHTYASASGSPFSVGLVIAYTTPDSSHTVPTKASYITVNPGYCKVPSLTGIKLDKADAVWQAVYTSPLDGLPHRFTGSVKRASGAPNGNFFITAQSIAAGTNATAPCTSDVYVGHP